MDHASELILDIEDMAALLGDGQDLLPAIERVEEHVGVTVERAIVDGAYGSGKNRAACAERPDKHIDLLSPMRRSTDPEVDKPAFNIDDHAQTATCAKGQIVLARSTQTDQDGRRACSYVFERTICEPCPLFTRCVHSKITGRTVTTLFYEDYLRVARQRQQTDEFNQLYRLRPRFEGKQAELVSHGLRKTRYLGKSKRSLQRLWLAAAVNMQRNFKLAEIRGNDLNSLLAPVCEGNITAGMV